MKNTPLLLLTQLLLITSASSLFVQENTIHLIPQPCHVTFHTGSFSLTPTTKIVMSAQSEETLKLAQYVAEFLSKPLAHTIEIRTHAPADLRDTITFVIDNSLASAPEGYMLEVLPEAITITASHIQGAFWGFQTLRQMLPPEVEQQIPLRNTHFQVPCLSVQDEPRFPYRGLHLDVSRHMFSIAFIKKLIDSMALYKLNTFHWHLTDDQGWRIEIKKYPRLQEIAAYRKETLLSHHTEKPERYDNTKYGGYYTQEEIKEVVAYAQQRQITIIPEIDIPGHSAAVLAAYPHLGCTHGPYQTATNWSMATWDFGNMYCAGSDEVFRFLEDVFTEVCDLFPSSYIHIGGDEVPKQYWEKCPACQERIERHHLKGENGLQHFFMHRIKNILHRKGRQVIAWNDMLEEAADPAITIMFWKGKEETVMDALQRGHQVVMTPYSHLYFDFYQSKKPHEPRAIHGYTPLEKTYTYDPISPHIPVGQQKQIMGAQGNIWTEYMQTPEQVMYMAFPRTLALAELTWSKQKNRTYPDFLERLKQQVSRLKNMTIVFCDQEIATEYIQEK